MSKKWHYYNNDKNNKFYYYKNNKKNKKHNVSFNSNINDKLNTNQPNNYEPELDCQNRIESFYQQQNVDINKQINYSNQKFGYETNNDALRKVEEIPQSKVVELFNDVEEDDGLKYHSHFDKRPFVGYVLGVFILIALVFGVTYAYFNIFKSDTRQADIVAGEVYVKVAENNLPISLTTANLYPHTKEEARKRTDNYVDFTVVGKNTSLNNSVLYKFTIANGSDVSGKDRISADYLLFDLAILDASNNETIIIDSATLSEFNNANLEYVNYVATNTSVQQDIKYRLRMWTSDKVIISDTNPNKTFTTTQFSNLYANAILNIATELTAKSLPLAIKDNKPSVVSGKSVVRTAITNFYSLNEDGDSLTNADVVRFVVTSPNNNLYFNYNDSENNEVLTNLESIDQTYNFTSNEEVTINVTLISRSGEDVVAPVTYKVYKNSRLIREYTQTVKVIGDNYCMNNGFTKLGDCILVSEGNYNSVSLAKAAIASKQDPNLTDTAPTYTDNERTIIDTENSEIGLYKTVDNQGDTYFFRGAVTNNNVLFAGLKWKIIRINGDGSIRLMYDLSNSSIVSDSFNILNNGPTYVGYMYNEESTPWESPSVLKDDINNSKTYYYADSFDTYVDDDGNTFYVLDTDINPMVQSTYAAIKTDYETNGSNSQIVKTPYTCLNEAVDAHCRYLYKIVSIEGDTSAYVTIMTMSPNSTDPSVVEANVKSSNAKMIAESWYQNTFSTLTNNNVAATNYVVDNIWCNDRSMDSGIRYPFGDNIVYISRSRITSNRATLLCSREGDTFSYSINNGNGLLSYPVGLITADEIVYAGGKYNVTNTGFYLYSPGKNLWSMTPGYLSLRRSTVGNFWISSTGSLSSGSVSGAHSIAPVINLSKNVMITGGNGEANNPYVIK